MEQPIEVRDEDVRALTVLQLALGGGPVLFWGVVAMMASAAPAAVEQADPANVRTIVLLSAVHAFMAPTQWVMGTALYRRQLAARGTSLMSRLRGATMVRLALFEAPALFGAVVCLIAVQQGVVGQVPWVWLNVLSTFMLLGLVMTTLPTRERVERLARDDVSHV